MYSEFGNLAEVSSSSSVDDKPDHYSRSINPSASKDRLVVSRDRLGPRAKSLEIPLRNRHEDISPSYQGRAKLKKLQTFYPHVSTEFGSKFGPHNNPDEFGRRNPFSYKDDFDAHKNEIDASITLPRISQPSDRYFPYTKPTERDMSLKAPTNRQTLYPKYYDPHDSFKYANNEIERRTRSKASQYNNEAYTSMISVSHADMDSIVYQGKHSQLLNGDETNQDFTNNDDGPETQDKYWYMYDPNVISRKNVRKLFLEQGGNNNLDNIKTLGNHKAHRGAVRNDKGSAWYMYDTALLSEHDVGLLLKDERYKDGNWNTTDNENFWDTTNGGIPHKDPYVLYKQLRSLEDQLFEKNDDQMKDLEEYNELSYINDRMTDTAPQTSDTYPYIHDSGSYPRRNILNTPIFYQNDAYTGSLTMGNQFLQNDGVFYNAERKPPNEQLHPDDSFTEAETQAKRDISKQRMDILTDNIRRHKDDVSDGKNGYAFIHGAGVKVRDVKGNTNDGEQMIADIFNKPNIPTFEHATDHMRQDRNRQISNLSNGNRLEQTRRETHLPNWYKPLTGTETINKRSMNRQSGILSSGRFWNKSYDFRRNLPKRTRWIRTRYGYWFAPSFSYDGRGPLDSLASALIG